jgi:HD domain
MVTDEVLLKLWAKKKTGSINYPLLYHMIDVAAVTRELWYKSLQAGARSFVIKELRIPEIECEKSVSF